MHASICAPRGLLSTGLALLLLPDATLGSDPNNSHGTVGFLVVLFLLLLLVLALAWRKLSQDSEGRYHPRHLCQPHRLLARLARRWQELLPERHSQGEEEEEEEAEDEDDEEDEEEEEDKETETLQRDEEEGGGGQEQAADSSEGTPLCEAPEGALEEAGKAEGASGLLSDLHSFSGTATWEDNAAEGSSRQHVTAL
ncbi:protein tyrosine phosphatase receptor type C-associated protein [Carettochelys insculpta]|uniref:protein tyrosine phosphatase receptor type C-associated protein n=1 Tax=Carettochelys insculpta TaxID=44489 RepID=UPI003EBA3169